MCAREASGTRRAIDAVMAFCCGDDLANDAATRAGLAGWPGVRRRAPLYELQVEYLSQGSDLLAAQQCRQPPGAFHAALLERLAHRAQADQRGKLDVIEADN